MIQKTYEVLMENTQNLLEGRVRLQAIVQKIREEPLYETASSIYIKAILANITEEQAGNITGFLHEKLPKAELAGMSLTLFAQKDQDKIVLRLNCCFFRSAKLVMLEQVGFSQCYETSGRAMGRRIAAMEDVKGVEILCTGGLTVDASKFIRGVSEGNESIPFFGAVAGTFEVEEIGDKERNIFRLTEGTMEAGMSGRKGNQFVLGRQLYREGLVLVAFCGKDLHVRADYILGWKPLGRELEVTGIASPICISCIDNMPAAEIYHRYLNVRADDKFLFNICEFPLMVERDGCLIARVPPCYDDEKRLYFNGDIQRGEKLRLSYGHPQEILRETWQASEEMRYFAPEGVWLVACGNRAFFLKEHADIEIDDYRRFCPDLMVSNGQAEIYRHEGKGGVLNTALIAVGMREGEAEDLPLAVDLCNCPYNEPSQIIPLSTRLATFLDVTAQDLKAMAIKAENASLAKSQFLSNMSHEIRTPINAVLGMDEMILRECKDKTIREYAENIRLAGNNLLGLVNDILDFSKIEAGKMDIIPVEYALSSMLNDLVNMIQRRAEKKGLKFVVQVPESIPSILFGDEIRIKQVITNILTNAVKYTETGTVTLFVDYERQDEENILFKVSVRDTGIGIREEDIEKLFHAFERIEEKRNRAIEGTGLGINITQKLLTLMGSQLEVSSIYGEGSVFSFVVKQEVRNWDAMGTFEDAYHRLLAEHETYKESFTAPTAKILVVDDTVMNITVVKGLLKQTRVKIDVAESGYECLNMVAKEHYDIIFLDHRMPGLDGIETLQRMRQLQGNLNKETPVISLTANAGSDMISMYEREGFDGYLVKPVAANLLEQEVLKFLPQRLVSLSSDTDMELPQHEELVRSPKRKLPIMISTDSVCDLPEDLIRRHHISIFPFRIQTEDGVFLDGEEIDPIGTISYIETTDKTAIVIPPEVNEYVEFFGERLDEAQRVIHITASKMMSPAFAKASIASATFDNVTIFDSGQMSSGIGFLVLGAARLAKNGATVKEILQYLEKEKPRIRTSFLLDNTKYLKRNGRVPKRATTICDAFMLRPAVVATAEGMRMQKLYPGKRFSTRRRYITQAFHLPNEIDDELLFLVYSGMPAKDLQAIEAQIRQRISFKKIIRQPVSSASASMFGPGTFGLVYLVKNRGDVLLS